MNSGSWLTGGPGIPRFSVGHLETQYFSRLRTVLERMMRSCFRTDVTEPLNPCWVSSNTSPMPARQSDWGSDSPAQGQWIGLPWSSPACKQMSWNGRVAFAHSSRVWRWEIRQAWSLIKDGSWHSRSSGSGLHSCHELLAVLCFSPHIPVALIPLCYWLHAGLCAISKAWPYSQGESIQKGTTSKN